MPNVNDPATIAELYEPLSLPPVAGGAPRVLIACERSGVIREAFRRRGVDAWSCDLQDSDIPGKHIKADVRNILNDGWDLMIAHPPCTHLAVSGARWFKDKQKEQREAIEFVLYLAKAPIKRICIENPVSIIPRFLDWPVQYIQPYQFGETECKKTGLWLKLLPPLFPTRVMAERNQTIWRLPPTEDRAKLRAATFPGIAEAIAEQWTRIL